MALRYKHSRSAEPRAEASASVLRRLLALVSDVEAATAVSIRGSECGHAASGGNETIVVLTRAGDLTTTLKIAKPLETVTQAEIADAFVSLPTRKVPG